MKASPATSVREAGGSTGSPSPDVTFVMTGAYGSTGGIASANRNVLEALRELVGETGGDLEVVAYLEREGARPEGWSHAWHALGGSRPLLVARVLRAAARRSLMVFDHVTLALPALPMTVPGLARSVIFAHGSEAWKRVRRTSRWAFRSSTLTLTNSEYTLRKMRDRLDSFPGRACPLGLSPEFPLNEELPRGRSPEVSLVAADGERREIGERALLLVGRMDPREREKGHRALLAVLPRLRASHSEVQLLFVGPGEDRDPLAARARGQGVADAVFLPGRVDSDLLRDLYRAAYALTMPSRQEGFGLVYLEAMNEAKPCVGSRDDGAEDVILDGETGYLVDDPRNPEELGRVLSRLLENPKRARDMGRAGFDRLHRRFTSRHHRERLRTALAPLLGQSGPGDIERRNR